MEFVRIDEGNPEILLDGVPNRLGVTFTNFAGSDTDFCAVLSLIRKKIDLASIRRIVFDESSKCDDISFLAECSSLEDLSIESSLITDVSVLAKMPGLISLEVGKNKGFNFDSLRQIPLKELGASNPSSRQVAEICRLSHLQRLALDSVNVERIEWERFSFLIELTLLRAKGAQFDAGTLSRLTKLELCRSRSINRIDFPESLRSIEIESCKSFDVQQMQCENLTNMVLRTVAPIESWDFLVAAKQLISIEIAATKTPLLVPDDLSSPSLS